MPEPSATIEIAQVSPLKAWDPATDQSLLGLNGPAKQVAEKSFSKIGKVGTGSTGC
jgi:hypothetical protein